MFGFLITFYITSIFPYTGSQLVRDRVAFWPKSKILGFDLQPANFQT
ncbi:hypothetical protein [Moorena sp. SIO3A5]|nr:hypothetical protein [Moorena sp. SIO3A5]NEQ06399.1 hypothetical protein [Moorena sp. SIO4E2]NEQ13337.1 hypothetical protein [Moorena sp. SIO3E2]NET67279.1 hypothetical protein [Moorena sp. SIO1G6]